MYYISHSCFAMADSSGVVPQSVNEVAFLTEVSTRPLGSLPGQKTPAEYRGKYLLSQTHIYDAAVR